LPPLKKGAYSESPRRNLVRNLGLVLLLLTAIYAFSQTDISAAKTACVINKGTDLGTIDDVREKLQQWGRWKLVARPEEADILLVVSDQEVAVGAISTANGYASGNGNYTTGSSTGISAPLVIPKVFLTAVDPKTGNIFTFVSAARRRHIGGSPAYLVSKLREQIEKHEKRANR
jgi:hypothetical protein